MSVPRPAATVCALRQTGADTEVLMVRRSRASRFMAGAWVFPGGAVDADDRELASHGAGGEHDDAGLDAAHRLAALRELGEETGIWLRSDGRLDITRLVYFARWITPSVAPIRFDTRFYAVDVAGGTSAVPDGVEVEAATWVRPDTALELRTAGRWVVPFPTVKTLELLTSHRTTAELADAFPTVEPVEPRIRLDANGTPSVLLPDDPGFAEAATHGELSGEVLARLARAAGEGGLPEADRR